MSFFQKVADELPLLPGYLAHHVLLTLAALVVSIIICVPLGMSAVRLPALRSSILAIAGVLQTIPGIALLALMVVLLGQIGFLPAFIALVLYSMLPIVRNTVTGLNGVAPAGGESPKARHSHRGRATRCDGSSMRRRSVVDQAAPSYCTRGRVRG